MDDRSTQAEPSTAYERLSGLLMCMHKAVQDAELAFEVGATLALAMELQAIALWVDDALAECDALHDTGDLSAFRDFVVRKSGGKQSAR